MFDKAGERCVELDVYVLLAARENAHCACNAVCRAVVRLISCLVATLIAMFGDGVGEFVWRRSVFHDNDFR